jgi:hypothetical protein
MRLNIPTTPPTAFVPQEVMAEFGGWDQRGRNGPSSRPPQGDLD